MYKTMFCKLCIVRTTIQRIYIKPARSTLGAVHKRRPQSWGRGVCPVRTFYGQGGSSNADVRTFLCKRPRIFWNLWCARTDKGGRGSIFRDFVWTSFMDGLYL